MNDDTYKGYMRGLMDAAHIAVEAELKSSYLLTGEAAAAAQRNVSSNAILRHREAWDRAYLETSVKGRDDA